MGRPTSKGSTMTFESPLYWKEMKKIRKALEKAQAPSFKRQALRETSNKHQASSTKDQAPSHKRQAP